MPIASRRAPSRGRAVVRRPRDRGQRSARSDRRRNEGPWCDLGSCGPVGPFGHDLRYRRRDWWVNALIHEHRTDLGGAVHGFGRPVAGLWI